MLLLYGCRIGSAGSQSTGGKLQCTPPSAAGLGRALSESGGGGSGGGRCIERRWPRPPPPMACGCGPCAGPGTAAPSIFFCSSIRSFSSCATPRPRCGIFLGLFFFDAHATPVGTPGPLPLPYLGNC